MAEEKEMAMKPYPPSIKCPICGQPMRREEKGLGSRGHRRLVAYECLNPSCPVIRYVPHLKELHLEARRR